MYYLLSESSNLMQSKFQGWLVDLVNKFGQADGFQLLLDRFTKGPSLSVPVIAALIRLVHYLRTFIR